MSRRLHVIGGIALPLPANDERPDLYGRLAANDPRGTVGVDGRATMESDPDTALASAALDFIRDNLVAFLAGVFVGVTGFAATAILLVSLR